MYKPGGGMRETALVAPGARNSLISDILAPKFHHCWLLEVLSFHVVTSKRHGEPAKNGRSVILTEMVYVLKIPSRPGT